MSVHQLRNREQTRASRAKERGDYQWCRTAQTEVAMPADGICLWCRTDHSWATLLTERQIESMRLLGRGLLRKQIAEELKGSEHTVANDWREVRMKLGARTTAQALAMLVREGSV